MSIKIKAWFGDWKDATREQARRFSPEAWSMELGR